MRLQCPYIVLVEVSLSPQFSTEQSKAIVKLYVRIVVGGKEMLCW